MTKDQPSPDIDSKGDPLYEFTAMNLRDNWIASGLQSLAAISAPVFSGVGGRSPVDYFVRAGEYLGKGFATVTDEAKSKSPRSMEFLSKRGAVPIDS